MIPPPSLSLSPNTQCNESDRRFVTTRRMSVFITWEEEKESPLLHYIEIGPNVEETKTPNLHTTFHGNREDGRCYLTHRRWLRLDPATRSPRSDPRNQFGQESTTPKVSTIVAVATAHHHFADRFVFGCAVCTSCICCCLAFVCPSLPLAMADGRRRQETDRSCCSGPREVQFWRVVVVTNGVMRETMRRGPSPPKFGHLSIIKTSSRDTEKVAKNDYE